MNSSICSSSNGRSVFSVHEKNVLLELVGEYKDIIECKSTNKTTNLEKSKAWVEISKRFSCELETTPRTAKQLKTCYLNMKKRAFAQKAEFLMEKRKTGGGKVKKNPPTQFDEKIIALNVLTAPLETQFDSEADVSANLSKSFFNYPKNIASLLKYFSSNLKV